MMAKFVICWFQGRGNLAFENLALRQQLAVLNRNAKRPQFRDSDRLFWVLFSRIADGWWKVLDRLNPSGLCGSRDHPQWVTSAEDSEILFGLLPSLAHSHVPGQGLSGVKGGGATGKG